jgi:hypothetical protein
MLGDRKDEWLAARFGDLGYGDIDGICRAARACRLEASRKTSSGLLTHSDEQGARIKASA